MKQVLAQDKTTKPEKKG